ncbi:hypothetical protein Ahy_A02g008727 [Arachis hypogaea]|uniref:Zinc knuckle CX2CX4HX4C domain-containing protein n=1 Tax=Arachis hypogaea TaxID=3818 RepID=A0A445EF97_ARAHY|nr:hypothetical protein Ahy_A02g008727 [Arachis hypogaea]
MLKIDRATFIHSRDRFAIICIEIDLSKKLVPRISVLGTILNIEYESLHLIYFSCGNYRHRADQCSECVVKNMMEQPEGAPMNGELSNNTFNKEDKKTPNNQVVQHANQDPPDFGQWMMVKRPSRRKQERFFTGNKKQNQANEERNNIISNKFSDKGSRFNVLFEENSDHLHASNVHEIISTIDAMQVEPPNQVYKKDLIASLTKNTIMGPEAGKNTQGPKKASSLKIDPIILKKGFKPKQRTFEKNSISLEVSPAVMQNVTSSSKNPNIKVMECEILNRMRYLAQQEQKMAEDVLKRHVVQNPFITQFSLCRDATIVATTREEGTHPDNDEKGTSISKKGKEHMVSMDANLVIMADAQRSA